MLLFPFAVYPLSARYHMINTSETLPAKETSERAVAGEDAALPENSWAQPA